ncbi:unnamed protein product [Adineta steineri]|uniref:Uncharacterized protein n=1 Tax=Adineta steineri TaxID=433720 RepID=A0A815A8J8_9BILA|nr:unnamed protein product [Adineta steineri]CAF1414789.1 unnamed protein product [Adineta steineri]CAF3592159.1 unnamed protein product [Adineta steineri]CAF3605083.1 unnamed protein product [Adineta steineri]
MNTNERVLENQVDLEKIWLRVATDIKIRKFENLVDIPEFHDLPNQLQNQLKNEMSNLNNDYKIFHNEQKFTNLHAILFSKRKDKYLAIYEEKTPSVAVRTSLATLGFTAVFIFIWHQLFQTFQETQMQQLPLVSNSPNGTSTVSDLNHLLSLVLSIVPSLFGYSHLQRWFSTRDSAYNKLVEGCMLKKLDGISNSQ